MPLEISKDGRFRVKPKSSYLLDVTGSPLELSAHIIVPEQLVATDTESLDLVNICERPPEVL